MWTPSDRRRALRALIAALWLVLGLPLAASWTAPALAAPQDSTALSQEELRTVLTKRYEALPISSGVMLKPRKERLGVRTIEVTRETIAVNGERVTPGVLRAWLGEDAEAILQLQALDEAERRELLGVETSGAPREEAAPEAGLEEDPEGREVEATPEEPEETLEPDEAETEIPAEPEISVEEESGVRNTGSRVNFGGGVTVRKDELAEEVVALGGPVRVEGRVDRDVVSVGSSVRVNGKVGGEVVSVGGGVFLGSQAEVDGNVTSVGGRVHRDPGARIGGDISEVAFLPALLGRDWSDRGFDWDWGPWGIYGSSMELVGTLIGIAVLLLFAWLTILVAREPLARVDRQLVAQPWKAGAAGLLAQLLFVPLVVIITVLLAITIVGCALFLLYPFAAIALALFGLLGYTAVAHRLGLWITHRFGRAQPNPYMAVLIGVAVIEIWALFGNLLGIGGGPLRLFSLMFLLFGWAVGYVAWTVGFGAVLLARFGTYPGYWPNRNAPIVPPTPAPPSDNLPLSESYGAPVDRT